MSAWSDLVKDLCKKNPGKPLGAILPLAKKMYKGTKKGVSGTQKGTQKNFKKMNRSFRRKSFRRGKK